MVVKFGGLNLRILWKYFTVYVFKKILYHRPSTPSCMVYGGVGKLPLQQVTIDKHFMSFWLRLLNKEESSLAHIVYMIANNLFVRDVYKAKWLCRVNNMVDNCGLSYLWLNQSMMDTNHASLIHTVDTHENPRGCTA